MAYTNFQHCTEEEYTNIIYSQDAKNKIKILFNNVELANADRYCEKLTRKERILPDDSSKRFSLDNFISQELELILHDVDSSVIKDQVSISIGTLVDENNDVYEYVPLGIFNIQDTPTTDKNKITVKLRDNRVKFDFNYNGKELIDAHDGSATKLQILQDICSKAGVQTTITSFAGDSDLIGIYDNTITATTYISYLAEQSGAIAKIDREGKLIFTYLTDSKNAIINGSGSINDSFNGGLIDFQVEGKAEQHSYSGKNYANTNKDPDWKYGNTVWERSGSNVTVKNNGTSSYAFVEYYVDNLKPNTTYTLSFDAVANDNGIINATISYPRATGGVTNIRSLNTAGKTAHLTGQFTTPSDTSGICIILYSVRGTYKANAKTTYSNIQIEEGSSETSYEPFTNNLPTPNPDYPQEIKSVSGIENLFDINATPILNINNNTIATPIENGVRVTIKNNTGGSIYFVLYKLIDVSNYVGKKFTIKMDFVSSVSNNARYIIGLCDENGENRKPSTAIDTSGTSYTYTIPTITTSKYLCVWLYSSKSGATTAGDYVDYTNIQVQMSDTIHTPVPYGHWLPVKMSNKNKFDEEIESGSYNVSTGVKTSNSNVRRNVNIIPVKPNATYIFSQNNNLFDVGVLFYNKNNDYLSYRVFRATEFTTPNNCYYINFFSSDLVNDSTKVQLEEGNTATSYTPHEEETTLIDLNEYDSNNNIVGNYELCSIKDETIKDLLTIKNGRAKITKNINSTLFNGTNIASIGNYKGIYGSNIPPNKIAQANVGLVYERAKFITLSAERAENTIYENTGNVVILGSKNDTLETLKEKFNGGLLYYVLATPETITLRGTYDINLYEGVNHISIEDELEPTMNITYSIEKTPKRIPLSIVEKYELGTPFKIERIVYEDALRKYQTSDDSEKQTLYINSANPYISSQLQIDNISARTKNFIIDSVDTGKILGNPALDSYDLIEVYDDYSQETTKPIIFRTLANNDLTYNGVLISEYDTQIGKEERTENVTIVGEPAFQKWAKAQIDNVESNVSIQTGRVDSLEDGMKNVYTIEQVNELVQDAERGVTNTFTKAGGNNIFRNTGLWFAQNDSNNPYEFWSGNVSRVKEDKAYNKNALSLQNSTLSQEQSIPNGDYTVSFIYKKLINLANVIVRINGVEYTLDSTEDKEFEENIIVSSQNIKIEFISDTANSCEIYDLMVNAGTVKLAYSQNQNETTTDTVNISKGITITSSDLDVKFKADADGIRTLDSNNTELTKFTDVGMTTKEAIIQSKSQIVGTLWQEVEEQTWITRL